MFHKKTNLTFMATRPGNEKSHGTLLITAEKTGVLIKALKRIERDEFSKPVGNAARGKR